MFPSFLKTPGKALKDLSFPRHGVYLPLPPTTHTGESQEHPLPSCKEGLNLSLLQTDLLVNLSVMADRIYP